MIIWVGTAYREDVSEGVCAKKTVFVRLRGIMNLLVLKKNTISYS